MALGMNKMRGKQHLKKIIFHIIFAAFAVFMTFRSKNCGCVCNILKFKEKYCSLIASLSQYVRFLNLNRRVK